VALTGQPLVVLLSAAVIALAGVAWRYAGWRRLTAGGGVVLVSVLLAAALANDHFDYLTSWRDLGGLHSRDLTTLPLSQVTAGMAQGVQRSSSSTTVTSGVGSGHRHGVLVRIQVPGVRSQVTRGALVYLPPEYWDPAWAAVRFPVLELLHGSPGAPVDWINGMRTDLQADAAVQARRTGPMVIVMPDTNGTRLRSDECVNAVHGTQDETYLTTDLRDYLLSHLRVRADRSGWTLAGYSTGGFCAVNILLHHPDLYAGAASLDGYFTAQVDRYTGSLYQHRTDVRRYNSPALLWRRAAPVQHTSLLLLSGAADDSLAETRRFASLVTRVSGPRVDVHLGVQPGAGHVFSSWRTMMPTVLAWSWDVSATPQTEPLAGVPVAPLPSVLVLPPPGCQVPDGGLPGVPVCRGHRGHHWYSTTYRATRPTTTVPPRP
jgi:enterochelin esterase-like enzyme